MQWRRKREGDIRNLVRDFKDFVGECATKHITKVLLIARVKISRSCSTIDFTEDYFRQQSRLTREQKEIS